MGALVGYERVDAVSVLSMDDGKANVLSVAMLEALNAALDRAESDGTAVVVEGRDGMFSGGFDLNVFKEGGPGQLRMVEAGARTAARLAAFPAPVVVACTGHAMAMGVFLMLAGDVRIGIAGAATKISVNEVAIGLAVPRFAIELCRSRLTPAAFTRAVTTAEVFTPDQGAAAGFLDAVVPAGELRAAARAKAAALAALNRQAFLTTKQRAKDALIAALGPAVEADIAAWRVTLA